MRDQQTVSACKYVITAVLIRAAPDRSVSRGHVSLRNLFLVEVENGRCLLAKETGVISGRTSGYLN